MLQSGSRLGPTLVTPQTLLTVTGNVSGGSPFRRNAPACRSRATPPAAADSPCEPMAFVTALQLAPVQERCGTCADGMEISSAPGRIRVVDALRPDRDSNAGPTASKIVKLSGWSPATRGYVRDLASGLGICRWSLMVGHLCFRRLCGLSWNLDGAGGLQCRLGHSQAVRARSPHLSRASVQP